jgi:hypothetical protein
MLYGTFGFGGPTDAGDVEPDHLDPGVDPVDERLEQGEAGLRCRRRASAWGRGGALPDGHP